MAGAWGGGAERARSVDYFTSLYEDPAPFLFMLSFYYTIPQLPLSLLVVWKGRELPVHWRIWVSSALMIVGMALMPVLAPKGPGYATALILLVGAATSLYQPSLFGLSSQFPGVYSQAQMTGQGLAGIVASLARIITKVSLSNGASGASSDAFFGVAAFVLVACMVAVWYLVRSEFAQRYMQTSVSAVIDADDSTPATTPLLLEEGSAAARAPEANGKADGGACSRLGLGRIPLLLQQAGVPLASVFFAFLITFIVFPGEIDQIPYYGTMGGKAALSKGEWWPILLLLEFNIFDTLGRSLSAFWHTSVRLTGILALARAVFIPMIVFLARTTPPTGGIVFSNDVSTIVVMILYSFSNGFVSSRALILAPTLVDGKDQEIVGFLMGSSLQLGILLGALIGLGISKS
jgi:equilibrative nucleoside transporter 1/2/3